MAVGSRALRELRRARSGLPSHHALVSLTCQLRHAPQCRWSSSTGAVDANAKEKPYYITTPIFYVNAAPHIGHLYSMVLSDVLKRWQQVKGKQAFLCTGTDEHGMKIQRAAAKLDVAPKEFCDGNAQKFAALAKMANVSHDFFIRTTDQEHKEAVAKFWLDLKHTLPEQLGLYKGVHRGWYCVSDECFYPEDLVQAIIEPQTGKKIMVSTESQNEVEWVEEQTWFFPLTKYKNALLKFYDDNPTWVDPPERMAEVRSWVETHLEDLSITRPASRLSWGIQDPEDADQTIYVWVDALINYITKAGYGSKWQSASEDMGIWPADLQVIGKDILRFHAVYWPALLLALNLPPPKRILCHTHWTMSNRKMSKSLGNVVDPVFAMQRWNVDPLRYFLVNNSNFTKDTSYSNELIGVDYEKHLRANMGNLFYRVAHSRVNLAWSTKEAVGAYRDGLFDSPDLVKKITDGAGKYHLLDQHLRETTQQFGENMDQLRPAQAIRATFELLRQTNRFITETEPWTLVKDVKDPRTRDQLNWVIFNAAEALRISAILLQPVMPDTMTRLLDELDVKAEDRTIDFAAWGKDRTYGVPTALQQGIHRRLDPHDSLFPPTAEFDKNSELAKNAKAAFWHKSKNKLNQASAWLSLEAEIGEKEAAEAAELRRMSGHSDRPGKATEIAEAGTARKASKASKETKREGS